VITMFLSQFWVHQFWVQRLGWPLLHFFWQGTAIAVVYAMLRSVLGRSLSAQARYVLACAALVAMAVAPALTFVLIPNGGALLTNTPLGTGSWTISGAESQRLLPVVVALWLLGVLAFSIRLLGGWRFTARLRSTSHPASAEWQQTLEQIAARVGAKQAVHLLVSSLVDVPSVVGWLRPVILVPVEFLTGLSVEHITALLAHEVAHIRRYDYLASILQSIVEAVLFYHPAVWWISEQIRAERELFCDDLAVAASGDVLAYARALAELESRQPSRLKPVLAANGGLLVNRIRRLIEPAHAFANAGPGPGTAWAMTLLWLAGVVVATVHGGQTPTAIVVNHDTVSVPAPSPLIALAGKARNTFLYDPLLPARPERNKRLSEEVEPAVVADPPEPEPAPEPEQNASYTMQKSGNQSAGDKIASGTTSGTMQPAEAAPPVPPPAVPAEPPPAPTFRVATRLVQVDVIARSKGVPAAGLTSEDFTLLDNGKPREIALFSVSSSQTAGPASAPLPAGVVSNRLERGSEALENATVLLIDRRNTPWNDQLFAIQRIVKFLQTRRDRYSKPDRIGIYIFGTDGSLQVVREITDDAELLNRAANSLRAGDSGMSEDRIPANRAMDTKQVLEAIARHLASVPGRKSLVWVTTGFPLGVPGQQPDFDVNSPIDEAARALNDANVALYPVDARGLVGALSGTTAISDAESGGPRSPAQLASQMHAGGGFLSGTDTMSRLADLTGGQVLYNANGIEDSIRKALDDSELTYTLGFYPAQEERDGVWHKVKVAVARRGVRVRYREKYFASRTLAEASGHPTLSELLKGPLDATQLELITETLPDRARPGCWQVRASVDLYGVHLENQNNTWSGAVDVSFFVEGSKTARTITRKVEIPDKQLAAALEKGIAVNDSIAMNGPAGELRIVAQDRATGAAGSVRVLLGPR
jgi:VWFA-related protein